MKGKLVSKAHSFKENILGAFGHLQNTEQSLNDGLVLDSEAKLGPVAKLNKKINSSDNLIEFSKPKSTDALVKEVHFSLRYFEVSSRKIRNIRNRFTCQ